LDPITALGVAGNIVQFIDFGLKATSKAREIHKSAAGALQENVDIEAIAEDLAAAITELEFSSTTPTDNGNLEDICARCKKTADDLSNALRLLKVEGKISKAKSARHALKAILGKKGVEEMKKKLEDFRDEMQFHVLVGLK
jgi:RNA binding exosome subunit